MTAHWSHIQKKKNITGDISKNHHSLENLGLHGTRKVIWIVSKQLRREEPDCLLVQQGVSPCSEISLPVRHFILKKLIITPFA